jgi:hypothetical protein
MPAKAKIFTKTVTPGKRGIYIDRDKYMPIHDAILAILKEKVEIRFADLPQAVLRKLRGKFDGNISWYTTSVKLDMERRKIIERIPSSRPQVLRIRKRQQKIS